MTAVNLCHNMLAQTVCAQLLLCSLDLKVECFFQQHLQESLYKLVLDLQALH